jgi:predicted dehydrogenase
LQSGAGAAAVGTAEAVRGQTVALPRIGVAGSPDQVGVLVSLLQSHQFKVTALWCKDYDKLCKVAKRYGVPFLAGDFTKLLLHPEVDLVYVGTAPIMQAEVAVKALTSGKHCICQTPPTINRSEALKMVRLSRYYGKLHSLLECHLRFLPAIHKLKMLLSVGYCGDLLVMEANVVMGSLVHDESYSWKCEGSMGGGLLNMVGADIIDLVSFLSDRHAVKGYASLNTFRPTTRTIHGYRAISSDDFCSFELKYPKGLSANVTLNSHAPGQFDFHFAVTGTLGRLVVKGLDLFGYRDGGKEEVLFRQAQVDFQKFGMRSSSKYPNDLLQHMVLGYHGMFESLVKVFCGQEGVLPLATFEDGFYIRTVLDALHASHAEGRWMEISELGRVKSSNNPFWTSSTQQTDHDSPNPS